MFYLLALRDLAPFMFWDSTVTFYVFFLFSHCFVLFRDSTHLSKVAATDGAPVLGERYHSGDKAFSGREAARSVSKINLMACLMSNSPFNALINRQNFVDLFCKCFPPVPIRFLHVEDRNDKFNCV